MLVTTRKSGDVIMINHGQIEIYILGLKHNRVDVGIIAPKSMPIIQKEAWLGEKLRSNPYKKSCHRKAVQWKSGKNKHVKNFSKTP